MWRLTVRQLWARGGRTVALGLAVLVAATGFTVLTESSDAARLEVIGTVNRQSDVGYDILVRPRGARSSVEKDQGLIEPGFLSGTYGGITLKQWHRIQHLSGIEVAAPIAMVGYAAPSFSIPVRVERALPAHGDGVARIQVQWTADQGLTKVEAPPDFVFVTDRSLRPREGTAHGGHWAIDGATTRGGVCPPPPQLVGPPAESAAKRDSIVLCASRDGSGDHDLWGGLPGKQIGMVVDFPYPFLIAAVDPASERALDGLGSDLVSGKGLAGAPLRSDKAYGAAGASVPVLVADAPQTSLDATITVSSVTDPAAVTTVLSDAQGDQLRGFASTPVATMRASSASLYPDLLRALAGDKSDEYYAGGNIRTLFTLGRPTWQQQKDGVLTPQVVHGLDAYYSDDAETFAPWPTGTDTAVRTSQHHQGPRLASGRRPMPASLMLRGVFDPGKLSGLSSVTARVLNGLLPIPLTGADPASRKLLGDRPLLPSANLAGLAQPPPLLLTSLKALPPLETRWSGSNEDQAPISAIRVRVAGVHGLDPTSRARVQLAAQRIQHATGLQVDLTVGSSATTQTIALPAGTEGGRPPLLLHQPWVKKGVGTAIISQVDRKSLILFVLVLLVSALTVANSAIASVRSRRTEFGVLAAVGWPASALFATTIAEVGAVAAAAGALSIGLSMLAGRLVGTPVPFERAVLALPAALLVAVVAGLVPALLATRARPLDAVAAPVSQPRRARPVSTLFALARTNLARVPSRTALAVIGLAVATLVFTVLLGVAIGFQGSVVGTVLGNAIAIQTHEADYVAAAATLILAGIGVANLMFLNIRERGPELATLQAVGWSDAHLARVLLGEGALLGFLGGGAGALAGYAATWALIGSLPIGVLAAGAIATLTGIVLALAGTTTATVLLRRLPTTRLLSEQT